MNLTQRSWAEIDLQALADNYRNIRSLLDEKTILLAVVKANGYGHGALPAAQTALLAGAGYLATATLEEALQLRYQEITAPILVLGYVLPEEMDRAVVNSITLTIYDEETARRLSEAADRLQKTAEVHIKVDTGMGRIGFQPDADAADTALRISQLPGIHIQGLFTHFALSDGKDKSYTQKQFASFLQFAELLTKRGLEIPLKHCANSAAIMELPQMQLDMVRAGIISYGLYPSDEVDRTRLDLTPVMRFKTRITHIKELDAGHSISYGCTYTTAQKTRIATAGVGYADGYSRLLSNQGYAMIHGKKAPLVGRVCMDQCMFDVTGIEDVQVGDEILLFGREEDGVTAEQVAGWMHTINYETVCLISERIPRVYLP